jgi:hypothetical protein
VKRVDRSMLRLGSSLVLTAMVLIWIFWLTFAHRLPPLDDRTVLALLIFWIIFRPTRSPR